MRLAAALLLPLAGCASPPRADAPLVLAENGRSKYRIVISRGATPSERYAAQEFRRLFREMSGVELPILEGARRDRFEIRIHDCEDVSVWEPGPDGYAIRARDDSITLAGGLPRGVVYAVYDFFEKRLGGRWFARDVAIMPRRDNMVLEPFHELHRPRFEYREVFYTEAFDGDFAARLRSNGAHARLDAKHGGKIAYFPFVHTFHTILPPDKYFKDHPEYFSEIDGRRVGAGAQLCLTNPDVLRLTIECVKGWIRDHPDAAIFSVSQNDCFNNCQCKSCKAIDEREGSPSGSLLAFVNKVAEAVPDRLIDTLAYQYTRRPPKNLKPRENVIVRLCSIECCFSHPIETCDVNQAFRDDLVAWSKVISWGRRWPEPVQRWVPGCDLFGGLYVWDYVTDFSHYLLPFPNLDVLGPNARFFAEHGVRGIFEEGNYSPGGGGEMSDLRAYVLGRVLWDPSTDVKKAIEEFTDAVYGEAGPLVREYLELLHRPVREKGIHVNIWAGPDSPHLAGDFLERAEAIFDKAAALVKDPATLKRLRKARMSVDYVRSVRNPERREAFLAACREFGITHLNEWEALK